MIRNLAKLNVKHISINGNIGILQYSKQAKLKLTVDEATKVLSYINRNDNGDSLKEINLSNARITRIENWKKAHGQFESVEQFADANGFGTKSFEKTCDAILKTYPDETKIELVEPNSNSKRSTKVKVVKLASSSESVKNPTEDNDTVTYKPTSKSSKRRVVTPILVAAKRDAIKTFTSIHMTQGGVAWAQFAIKNDELKRQKTECAEIVDWGHLMYDFHKAHLLDLVNLGLRINKKIPHSDVYVLEEQNSFNTQQIQSVALLTGLLANRANSHGEKNVYFMANRISGQLYGIFVGGEVTSPKHIVQILMDKQESANDFIVDSVVASMKTANYTFSPAIRRLYMQSRAIERELMGRALIIGTTFLRTCILCCSNSLTLAYNQMRSEPLIKR